MARLGAVKRLYLRLFIDRQYDGMGSRCHVKPDHIAQLFGESRVVGQRERAPVVRGRAMCLPDVAHPKSSVRSRPPAP